MGAYALSFENSILTPHKNVNLVAEIIVFIFLVPYVMPSQQLLSKIWRFYLNFLFSDFYQSG